MAGIFRPRIIIGSVVGFIATAIGVIAVFFPSLFNLEQQKIVEYTSILTNENDYVKFLDFIKNNQNKIVKLDLTYFENERWRWEEDKNGNVIFDKNDEQIKENLDHEGDGDIIGKQSFATIDDKGHMFIGSEFHRPPFLNNFYREKGGIAIWIPGKKDDGSDDINYVIVISESSDGNKLYKWSMKNRNKDIREMQLNGTFFVNPIVTSSDYSKDVHYSMSTQWSEEYCGADSCNDTNIIDLEALSKKEIESKKY